jgi:fermentation-respiration switch protein FrsA (DUF1100 family)
MLHWFIGEFSVARLVRSSLLIYGLFAGYVFFRADSMIFVPPASSYADTPDLLKIPTVGDRQLTALMLNSVDAQGKTTPQSEQSESDTTLPEHSLVLLYSHGNAEDLGMIRPVLERLTQTGAAVFAYDYQGYGTSEGEPTERGAYADIAAAYTYLTETLNIAPDRVILHGRSVGGGPSVDLATRKPIAGLILESTFTSAFRTVIPFPFLPFDKFPNLSNIDAVDCPVLIIHGTADRTVPPWHGETLLSRAPEPKSALWVDGAGHNDLVWVAGDRYIDAIETFINQLGH